MHCGNNLAGTPTNPDAYGRVKNDGPFWRNLANAASTVVSAPWRLPRVWPVPSGRELLARPPAGCVAFRSPSFSSRAFFSALCAADALLRDAAAARLAARQPGMPFATEGGW